MGPYREAYVEPKKPWHHQVYWWLRWQHIRAQFLWRLFKIKNPIWPFW